MYIVGTYTLNKILRTRIKFFGYFILHLSCIVAALLKLFEILKIWSFFTLDIWFNSSIADPYGVTDANLMPVTNVFQRV